MEKDNKREIRIIATPLGSAPEDVRKAWVGLILPIEEVPLDEGVTVGATGGAPDPSNSGGFSVEIQTALSILEQNHPKAAKWWRDSSIIQRFGEYFVFGKEFCELVS